MKAGIIFLLLALHWVYVQSVVILGQPAEPLLAISAGRLIDGISDVPRRDVTVLVRGDRILEIGSGIEIPAEAERIDLGTATLLPGLIDLHTHLTDKVGLHWEQILVSTTPGEAALWGARNALDTLLAGFTACRDMGPTWPYVDVDLRRAIDNGVVPGPRLMVAGNYVSSTGGAGDARQFSIYVDVPLVRNLADGVDAVRLAVRTNFKHGADFVKILATGAVLSQGIPPGAQQYSDEELSAAVEEARRWGRFVAAHAHGTAGIKAAIRAGVRTIDHGTLLDDEAISMMKDRGVYLAPTLYVGEAILRQGAQLGIPADQVARERELADDDNRSFRRALAAGLSMPVATDAGVFPHGQNARELTIRVAEGETPMQAIQSATRVAAEAIGWDDRIGTLQTGKLADMIAVMGDPLEDIRVLEQVSWVMKGGVIYKNQLPPDQRDR